MDPVHMPSPVRVNGDEWRVCDERFSRIKVPNFWRTQTPKEGDLRASDERRIAPDTGLSWAILTAYPRDHPCIKSLLKRSHRSDRATRTTSKSERQHDIARVAAETSHLLRSVAS